MEEISASKFQGQHAGQFRYESWCSATKTEIQCGCFPRNFAKFQNSYFQNNFWELLLKIKQEGERRVVTFVVSGFYMFQVSYLLSYETIFFLRNFCIEEPFNLDYIIHFYKPKKGLSCAIFTLKILVEKYLVGQMIKVLPGNLSTCNLSWLRYNTISQ